ncbi:MAG: response regulator transcription factor [Pyrinomonadaceae bacterium]|nr:response regulator transcription factor [Pyrinomonadaceae bacterium]
MRILLVEDDEGISNFIVKGLQESAFAVDVAVNGEDALYQVSINTYDLIILDVIIPIKDGFEVCKELREKGVQIPILMLTAKDEVEDRIEGLEAGADDYLTKPFAYGELLARVHALMRRKEKSYVESRFTVSDLEIDSNSQKLWREGKEIPLTAKEFTVLEYLARNANRVIGREEISEHCWNETYDPFSNSIEVIVNRLRKKIDQEADTTLLQTRRGAGYMLEDRRSNEDI